MTAQIAPSAEVAAYAEALRRLRKRAGPDGRGVSQEQAATAVGQRKQSWQAYEMGHRQVILRTDVQDRLTRALGFTREDLQRERGQIAGAAADRLENPGNDPSPSLPPAQGEQVRVPSLSVPALGRGRGGAKGAHLYEQGEPERWLDLGAIYGASCRAMQLIGDSMYPWAASGTTIVYDVDRWPRAGQGCVIETKDRGIFVKLFERVDDAEVFVRTLQPDQIDGFALEDVVGVYAVQDRIDR